MRMKGIISSVTLILLALSVSAQNELWYFGGDVVGKAWSNALYFNGPGSPTVTTNGPKFVYEATSTVGDGNGNPILWTDGITVTDGTGAKVPNLVSYAGGVNGPGFLSGSGEGNTISGSSPNGSLIINEPGSSDRYYIFSVGETNTGNSNGFRYTVFDASLPGNGSVGAPLGDLDPAIIDLLVTPELMTEALTAYGSPCGDTTWVVVHAQSGQNFYSYPVTSAGIGPRVVSAVGNGITNASGNTRGTVSISPDGTKLVLALSGPNNIELYDFNAGNGQISNPLEIESASYYGSEFSPDGNIVYYTSVNGAFKRYIISTNTVEVIPGSSALNWGDPELGPNGRIYFTKHHAWGSSSIGEITDPNNLNAALIGYNENAIPLPGTASSGLNQVFLNLPGSGGTQANITQNDAAICDSTSAFNFTATPANGNWSTNPVGLIDASTGLFDPATALAAVGDGGVVQIIYGGNCIIADTIYDTIVACCGDIDPNLGANQVICDDATFSLNAGAGYANYTWFENGTLQVANTGATLTADSGTYVVQVLDADGCPGADTIEIGNYQLPQPDLGPDTAFCAGLSLTLDAGVYAGYSWSSGGSSQTEVANAAATYTVTVTDANGCQGSDDVVVTQRALPVPTISGGTIVCQDSSTQITGNAGSGGTLVWSGITPFANPLSVQAGGTYWLIETDAFGCIDSVSHTVTLENLPSVDLGGPFTICRTQETETLDANTGTGTDTYLWNDASTNATLDATDAGEYSVIVTSANGCIAYDTATVDTFSLPTVDLGPDSFYCAGLSMDLDAGAGFASYAWTPSGSAQTLTVNAANTYGVTITDGNGCTATDDVVITENDLPTVDLGGAISVCESDSLTLDATHADAASYAWTPNSETSATIRVGSEDATYGVTVTDVDGCVFTTSRTISEDSPPTVDLGGDDIICDDATKTLDAGAAAGVTYAWYLDGTLIAGETGQTLDADSGVYVVVVSTALGCEARDTAYIDNHQLPVVDLDATYEFCELDSVELDAGNPGATFLWNTTATTQTIWATTAGTFSVEVTDANTCTNTGSATIVENSLPVFDIGDNDSACVGLAINLDATAADGVTYLWSDGTTTPTYALVGPDTLSVIVTDSNGCVGYDTIEIAALDSLDLGFMPDDNQVCEGSEGDNPLDGGSFAGATYVWTLPDGSTENGQVIIPLLNGLYTVNITDEYNCKGADSITNVVIPVPNIDLGEDSSFCSLGSDTYTVRMEFTEDIPGIISWMEDNNNSNDTLFTATYTPISIIGTFTDNATGCVHIDTVELTEFCEPTIIDLPNIFIPGGETGGNTTFRPINMTDETFMDLVNNIVWSDFQVYNRWGLKVFQSEDLIPNWDGMYENRPTASGVYYWIYKYKDSSLKEYTLNGFVQVIQKRD